MSEGLYDLLVICMCASLLWFLVGLIFGYYIYAPSWWERYIELPIIIALDIWVLVNAGRRFITYLRWSKYSRNVLKRCIDTCRDVCGDDELCRQLCISKCLRDLY